MVKGEEKGPRESERGLFSDLVHEVCFELRGLVSLKKEERLKYHSGCTG